MDDAPSPLADLERRLPEPVRQTVVQLRAVRSPWGLTGDATTTIAAVRRAAEDSEEHERQRWWDQVEAWLAELADDETYRTTARAIVETAAARLRDIADGTVPYIADQAFAKQDVPVLELAVEVMTAVDDRWTDQVLPALLVGAVVAPDPHARSVPSQAAYYALTRCVLARPTLALAQAVRAAGAATRHAGVKKKTARIAREVDRALVRAGDIGHLPDLGLDADGRFDTGHGQTLTVTFDERLRLVLLDSTSRRAAPPRSTTEAGRAAAERLRTLRHQARQVARTETRRLEEAMITQRTWTPDELDRLVRHPLLGYLVRHLLWETDGIRFTVLADQTFADADDTPVRPSGPVRLVHPVTVPPADLAVWQRIFFDDEIHQPFPQLARETYPPERAATLVDVTASTRRLFGLTRRTWTLDGWHGETLTRLLPDGRTAVVTLSPGITGWDPTTVETQTVSLRPPTHLNAIETSEVVRDLVPCLVTT